MLAVSFVDLIWPVFLLGLNIAIIFLLIALIVLVKKLLRNQSDENYLHRQQDNEELGSDANNRL